MQTVTFYKAFSQKRRLVLPQDHTWESFLPRPVLWEWGGREALFADEDRKVTGSPSGWADPSPPGSRTPRLGTSRSVNLP